MVLLALHGCAYTMDNNIAIIFFWPFFYFNNKFDFCILPVGCMCLVV